MDFNWMIPVLLLSTRVAAATMLTSVLGPTSIPNVVRVILALTLGACLSFALPSNVIATTSTLTSMGLVVAMLRELVIGASFSLGFMAAYAATQVAGRILDVQIGFGVAGVLNPATSSFSPLLGSLFGMVGVAVFLILDGHHQLLRALALSAEIAQPGLFATTFDMAAMLQQTTAMFIFGLMLAAPIMLALLLIDLAMAVYARSLPQLNILVLSFAIKVVVGVALLSLSIKWSQETFERLYQTTFEYWATQAEMR
jgi:flagellar biosynthetic protein FliR